MRSDSTMNIGSSDKKHYEKLFQENSQLRKQEEIREDLTKAFIQNINGILQSIMGNAELLKLKHTYELNRETVDYLHKIEKNSEHLLNLLNTFQDTIQSDKTIDASRTVPRI